MKCPICDMTDDPTMILPHFHELGKGFVIAYWSYLNASSKTEVWKIWKNGEEMLMELDGWVYMDLDRVKALMVLA